MNSVAKQIGLILLASMALAVTGGMLHPRRIPWVQDWSNQIERQAEDRNIRMVPLAVAQELFRSSDVTFIDARPLQQYTKGHIPNAVSIPFEQFDERILQIMSLIDSGKVLVVYCSNRLCDEALLLAAEMKTMGADTLLFIDGFERWEKNGAGVPR